MVEQATADRQVSGSIPEGSFFAFQYFGGGYFTTFGIILGRSIVQNLNVLKDN